MNRIQTPQFVSDFLRDLRDRRLVIPVVALLVALVGVPVVLSSGGAEVVAPPAPAPVDAEDATQVQSAVLAEQSGIRNYRKRLEALKSKNPFKQQFTSIPGSKDGGDQDAGGDSGSVSSVLDALSNGTSAGGSSAPDQPVSSDGGEGTSSSVEPPASAPASTEPRPVKPQIRFFSGRVDVTVGPLEDTKKVRGVRALDMLPSEKLPVAAFMGLTEDGGKAVFVVSSHVTHSDGDGSCTPRGGDCQFLRLDVGEQRFFHFPRGAIFRLRVLDTDYVRIADPRK
ncbi:MAG: hypothetical protein ACRDKX_03315 [Solirubrobacterales bacterium]